MHCYSYFIQDEADLLCDRIAIIAAGRLCCAGSSMFLKKAFGAGYTVTICLNQTHTQSLLERITHLVVHHVREARLVDTAGQDVSFLLPAVKVALFEKMFLALEGAREELGIVNYGVSATTLEDVFLRVAAEADTLPKQEDMDLGMTSVNFMDDNRSHSVCTCPPRNSSL
jgi:ABC-type multidrug transport system ATPase subunit